MPTIIWICNLVSGPLTKEAGAVALLKICLQEIFSHLSHATGYPCVKILLLVFSVHMLMLRIVPLKMPTCSLLFKVQQACI